MADVEIRRAAYDDVLKTAIYNMLTTGGVDRIARGRVLIKPNLLLAAAPAQAVTTHPRVVRAGVDKSLFARLVVQIHQVIAPAFTLIDGIVGLDGHGPGKAGRPVPLGLLIGSWNAFAADHAVCDLIGLPPAQLPTLAAADALGIAHSPARVTGDGPDHIPFKLPDAGTTHFGPEFLQPFLRRHLLRRPVADAELCRLCGECWQYCPAEAIQCRDDRLHFDYNRCIRCYCCIEVCPHGALTSAETLPGRLLHHLWR